MEKNNKDLPLNYFFIDFDHKHNAKDSITAYTQFLMNEEDSHEV